METHFKILDLPGSPRAGSLNSGLLRVARGLAPAGGPDAVRELKARAQAADALLFAAPEYNYSMTGVRKNLIDWLSRPVATSPLRHTISMRAGDSPMSRSGSVWRRLSRRWWHRHGRWRVLARRIAFGA